MLLNFIPSTVGALGTPKLYKDGSPIARLVIESSCYFHILWKQLFLEGFSFNMYNASEVRATFVECIQNAIDQALPRRDQFSIDKILGGNKLVVPPSMEGAVNHVAKSLGYSASLQFIEKCAMLWETLSNGEHKLIMLSGDPGCGKSAVLKTVLRCMSKTGLAKLPPYVDIDDSMWFRSATMIFRSVMQWWTHHQKLKAKKGEKIVSDEVDQ